MSNKINSKINFYIHDLLDCRKNNSTNNSNTNNNNDENNSQDSSNKNCFEHDSSSKINDNITDQKDLKMKKYDCKMQSHHFNDSLLDRNNYNDTDDSHSNTKDEYEVGSTTTTDKLQSTGLTLETASMLNKLTHRLFSCNVNNCSGQQLPVDWKQLLLQIKQRQLTANRMENVDDANNKCTFQSEVNNVKKTQKLKYSKVDIEKIINDFDHNTNQNHNSCLDEKLYCIWQHHYLNGLSNDAMANSCTEKIVDLLSKCDHETHEFFSLLLHNSLSTYPSIPIYSQNCIPNAKHCRRRKARTVFSDYQLSGLEHRFDSQHYLSTPERNELANQLNLSETQIKTWFQNRRMKHKKVKLSNQDGDPCEQYILPYTSSNNNKNNTLNPNGNDLFRSEPFALQQNSAVLDKIQTSVSIHEHDLMKHNQLDLNQSSSNWSVFQTHPYFNSVPTKMYDLLENNAHQNDDSMTNSLNPQHHLSLKFKNYTTICNASSMFNKTLSMQVSEPN